VKSKAKDDPLAKVVWLDRGWQPVYHGFCPSEAAWKREMRKLKVKGEAYPDSAGRCTTFTHEDKTCCIVTLGPQADAPGRTRVEIAGLLCHEATHVWQEVQKSMNDPGKPSVEFEAYSMQAIFMGLYQAWLDTRAPEELKARSHKRRKVAA
jgi:hypothetical protein